MCEQPVLPQDLNFSFRVHVSLCWCGSEAGLKPKTNQDQLWNRMHNAVEVKSDERKGRFVYPWWSVDVGGLCFRNIQISLFKIFWYLTLGTDKKTLAWTWTRLGMCNRALLCFTYRFNLLYFPPFQLLFSACAHAQRECQFSIDYSTIKVMVILNNMTCIEYSWKWWLTYSQFLGIMVWPPAGWRHSLKSK